MIALDWTPERCRQEYSKRFGVETSYRLGNKQLGWTTSPNAAYRFVLIGLGFLLLKRVGAFVLALHSSGASRTTRLCLVFVSPSALSQFFETCFRTHLWHGQ